MFDFVRPKFNKAKFWERVEEEARAELLNMAQLRKRAGLGNHTWHRLRRTDSKATTGVIEVCIVLDLDPRIFFEA